MRHYTRYGQLVGAMILSLGLAAPVMAQAVPRHGDWDRDRGGWYGGNGDAYRNGFEAGVREGERDARDRKDYGFKRWYPEQGLSTYEYAGTIEKWNKLLLQIARK